MNDFKYVDGVKIYLTDEEQKELDNLRKESKKSDYARKRKMNYKEIDYGEQLDMLWHAIDGASSLEDLKKSEFFTWRKEIKENHPKPRESKDESR